LTKSPPIQGGFCDSVLFLHLVNLILQGKRMDISNLPAADLRSLQESIKQELKKRESQEIANARNQIISISQSVGLSQVRPGGRAVPQSGKCSRAVDGARSSAEVDQGSACGRQDAGCAAEMNSINGIN
jgi:DNA-binding protein H-NS